MIIGTYRKFGEAGPVYLVVKLAGEDPDSGIMVEILMVESGEVALLPLKDVENDPLAE